MEDNKYIGNFVNSYKMHSIWRQGLEAGQAISGQGQGQGGQQGGQQSMNVSVSGQQEQQGQQGQGLFSGNGQQNGMKKY